MRKKSLSITEIAPLPMGKIRATRNKSILSIPQAENNQTVLSGTKFDENPQPVKEIVKEAFKIRKVSSQKSFTHKTVVQSKNKEEVKCPQSLIDQLDSLEKCRKVFDRIIKKDKKFGDVLAKIKEVYESELMHAPKVKSESRLNFEFNKYTKVSSVPSLAVRNELSSRKVCKKREPEIGSGSDLETVYSSERGRIPELTLGNIKRTDFHEEFMSNYPEFSESWRKLIKK